MSGSKRKGDRVERRVANMLGGKRAPLSGAVGGGDVWLPSGSIWEDWVIEVKARKSPSFSTVRQALAQADAACAGTRRRALAVIVPDREAPLAVVRLEDLVSWAEALAEMGAGAKVRSLLRQVRRVLDEIEEVAR